MTDTITLTGLVATPPRTLTTSEGLSITSFRLASSQRRFDRATQQWIDAETNWYTISAFRQTARNAAESLVKNDRVLVTGRLRLRNWQAGEKSGLSVEVDVEAIGHDLTWGTSSFTRSTGGAQVSMPPASAELGGQASSGSDAAGVTDPERGPVPHDADADESARSVDVWAAAPLSTGSSATVDTPF